MSDGAIAPVETGGNIDNKPSWWERFFEQTGVDVIACPSCDSGRMACTQELSSSEIIQLVEKIDTS